MLYYPKISINSSTLFQSYIKQVRNLYIYKTRLNTMFIYKIVDFVLIKLLNY